MKSCHFWPVRLLAFSKFTVFGIAFLLNLIPNTSAQTLPPPKCGVTIITHGFCPDGKFPYWLEIMSDSIAKRQGSQIRKLRYNENGEISMVPYSFEKLDTSLGLVLVLDWSIASNLGDLNEHTTTAVADKFFTAVFEQNQYWQPSVTPERGPINPAEVPIHLIGHSRGGSLVSRLAYRLAEGGILVDHVTTLDPHPVTIGTANDWWPESYVNTIFSENYYRTGDGFNGIVVSGSTNYYFPFLDQYADEYSLDHHAPHSLVHAYYFGTIGVSQYYEPSLIDSIPSSWYQGSDAQPARESIGYSFSRYVKYQRPSWGLSQYIAAGQGTGSRVQVSSTYMDWPNVTFNQSGWSPRTVRIGQTVEIPYWQINRKRSQQITFFLDNDTNPYNGFKRELGSAQHSPSGGIIGSGLFSFTAGPDDVGSYYIGARAQNIPETFHVRYDYLMEPFAVVDDLVLHVWPTTGYSGSGSSGGPFEPDQKSVRMTNYDSAPLAWSASTNVNWITLSSQSGILASDGGNGDFADLAYGPNNRANELAPGIHTGKITITGPGKPIEIPVSLTVFARPPTGTLSDLVPKNSQGQYGMRVQYRSLVTNTYTDLTYAKDYEWRTYGDMPWNLPIVRAEADGSILVHPSGVISLGYDRDVVMRVLNQNGLRRVRISGSTASRFGFNATVRYYIYKGAANWADPIWTGVVGDNIDISLDTAPGEELFFAVNCDGKDGQDHALWKDLRMDTIGPGLTPPALVSPGSPSSPGPSGITLAPALSWQAAGGASGYGLTVRDAATNSVVYRNDGLGSATSFALPAGILSAGRNYAWKVRARNINGWSEYSAEHFFQTLLIQLPAPQVWTDYELRSSDLTANSATIHWAWSGNLANSSGIAIGVRQLNSDGSDGPVLPGASLSVDKTLFTVPNLSPASRYRINVAYQANAGYLPGSTALEFYTRFPTPTPVSPVSGATVTGPMTFSWQEYAGLPVGAKVQISTTSSGFSPWHGWSSTFDEGFVSGNTFTWNAGQDGQTYWWSARQASNNQAGPGTSLYSTPRPFTFQTPDVPLARPVNTTPYDNIGTNAANLTWSWSGDPAHATSIHVTLRRLNPDGSDTSDVRNSTLASTATTTTFSNLNQDTPYRVNVSYRPQDGYLEGSHSWTFRTRENQAPNVSILGIPVQLEDGRIQLDFHATDPEGDPMTCQISLSRRGSSAVLTNSQLQRGTLAGGSNSVYFTTAEIAAIPELVAGEYYVNLRIADPLHPMGTSAPLFITAVFTYALPNEAPSFTVNPIALDATEDLPFHGQLSATDPDSGDSLTFSKTSGPGWLDVAWDGALSGTPMNQHVGTNTFGVRVVDRSGEAATATLIIHVDNTNDWPFFPAPPAPGQATEDVPYSGTLAGTATDPDADDSLAYSKASGPAWLIVGPDGQLSGSPTNANVGPNTFQIRATDRAGLHATGTLNIEVLNVNKAPVFIPGALSFSILVDRAFAHQIIAVDEDAGDTFGFTKVSGPGWLELSATGLLSGTPEAADLGASEMVVRATDSQGASTDLAIPFAVVSAATWINPNGGTWSVVDNWSFGRLPSGIGEIADFSTLDLTNDATVTLDGAKTAGKLSFGDTTGTHDWMLVAGSGEALTLTVDAGSPTIAVANQTTHVSVVLAGNQGLVKTGAGQLALNAANTYTGNTTVESGTLGGNGIINGPVEVGDTAILSPGLSGISTFTINNTLALSSGSTTIMQVAKNSGLPTSDRISGLAGVNYGGTLRVELTDGTLTPGDKFVIFSKNSGSFSGAFTALELPALPPGQIWVTSSLLLDGSIRVSDGVTPELYDLFADNFNRSDSTDINSSSTGKSGILGNLNWSSLRIGTILDHSIDVSGNQLRLNNGNNNSIGSAGSVVWVDHNFTGLNEFTVSLDIASAQSGGEGREVGIGIGQSVAELNAMTGAAAGGSLADIFVAYDSVGTTTGIRVRENGTTIGFITSGGLSVPDTLAVKYRFANMNAGSPISYTIYLNGLEVATRAAFWSGTNENFVSLQTVYTDDVRFDNFHISGSFASENNPPEWIANPMAMVAATENSPYFESLGGRAMDDDEDPLMYGKVSGPAWLSVASDGSIAGTPGAADAGLNQFVVSVSDGIGLPVETTMLIHVRTAYEAWAGIGIPFENDANSDGIADGIAWLLGADHPSAGAHALLPSATAQAENVSVRFRCLKAAKRGSAVLRMQYSRDLGATDSWEGHTISVPATSGTVGGVVFEIIPIDGSDLEEVRATIPASAAQGTGNLFVRLAGSCPIP